MCVRVCCPSCTSLWLTQRTQLHCTLCLPCWERDILPWLNTTTSYFSKGLGSHSKPHLTYNHHITHVVLSCFSILYQISHVKKSLDKEISKLLIATFVLSKMLYCSTVWSNTLAGNISKLESIQNFANKIVTTSKKFDHVAPLLCQLNWLPVRQLLLYKDAVTTYKCLHDLAPQHLSDQFIKCSNIHACYTSKRDSLQIPICKTATSQCTFTNRATNLWNSLDNDIKNCTSLKSFRITLREYLHTVCYHKPSELVQL